MSQRGNATGFQGGIITAKNPIGYLEAFDRFILSIFPLNCFQKKVQVTTVIERNIRKCPLGFPCLTFNLSLSRRAWGDKSQLFCFVFFLLSVFNTVAHLKKKHLLHYFFFFSLSLFLKISYQGRHFEQGLGQSPDRLPRAGQ